jgi:hypothetical protein
VPQYLPEPLRPLHGHATIAVHTQVAKTAVHARVSALCTDIRQNPFTLRLVMQPFTPEQTHAFLAAALKGVHVSVEVARNLWEKTGGLPLYIEQVCCLKKYTASYHTCPCIPPVPGAEEPGL